MILWKKQLLLCLCFVFPAPLAYLQAEEAAPPGTVVAGRPLRRILIADSVEEAQKITPAPESGFVVVSPGLAWLDLAELGKRLAAGENRIIDETLLASVAQVIEVFIRQNEYPNASAIIPTQRAIEGAVRVLVVLGEKSKSVPVTASTEWKIRNISVQGTHWFSESLLREKLRIEKGRTVRFSELDRAIGWTNNNPFRRVRVHLEPIANTGEADLTVTVQDALPLRFAASVDNSGNDVIGNYRYTASITYANLWGLDHTIAYQYITTSKPNFFQGHGLDYRIPLPWRHYLQLSASYMRSQPEFYQGLFLQNGETITSDIRYTIPLRTGDNSAEVYAGLNFKESNNNLTWDPHINNVQVLSTKTDIFQFTLGGSVVRRDKRGAWAFGASVTASPGGINSRNTDAAFDAGRYGGGDSARIGAKASYAYGSVSVQRLLKLRHGWELVSRGVGQVSQANLLPSEQLTIGGSSTVRGFNESVFAGDHGFLFTNDLMAPAWKKPLPWISKTRGPLETRLLVFVDAGNTGVRYRYPTDNRRVALASTGVGVRMNYATNFSLTADYGWQLTNLPYPVEEHSRAHIRATLAF